MKKVMDFTKAGFSWSLAKSDSEALMQVTKDIIKVVSRIISPLL